MLNTNEQVTEFCEDLKERLTTIKSKSILQKSIVNSPFINPSKVVSLDLGIIVLLMVNPKTDMLDRIALSDTEMAKGAVEMSAKPFKEIKIPMDEKDNILVRAIKKDKPLRTSDWQELFTPALTARQARFNQAGAGIECSVAWPIDIPDGGALIFSYYQPPEKLTDLHEHFMRCYGEIASNALTNVLT